MDERITRQKICAIADLPEPSVALMNLIPILASGNLDIEALSLEISRDPVLVSRILRLVNSSYFHLRHKVDSVKSAITMLGIVNIRQAVFSAVCFDYFPKDAQEEWRHAFTSSLLISELMRNNYIPSGGCLQLTAILHDIGKFIFRRKLPQRYGNAVLQSKAEMMPIHLVERRLFECDHAEVGGWLLEAWDMCDEIVVPIKCHHSDTLPERYTREAAILRLADWMDFAARLGSDALPPAELMDAAGIYDMDLRLLKISQQELISAMDGERWSVVALAG